MRKRIAKTAQIALLRPIFGVNSGNPERSRCRTPYSLWIKVLGDFARVRQPTFQDAILQF
jgi:hypothetical protein